VGLMLLLCMIWGLQQVAIKAAAHDIAPIMQVALRSGMSAFLVGMVMLARRERFFLSDGTLVSVFGHVLYKAGLRLAQDNDWRASMWQG
jgi:drug/metabolite transporter (DMT)-like permease